MRRLALVSILALGCGEASGPDAADTDSGSSDGTEATGPTAATTTTTGSDATSDDATGDASSSDTGPPPPTSGCDALLELVDGLEATEDPTAQAYLINDFLQEVVWSDAGVPIVEPTRTCIFHIGDPDASISVAGDFDGWDPAAHPLTAVASVAQLGFHFAIVEQPDTDATGLYKLVRDGAEFFADPHARRFGWDEFGEYSQLAPRPDRSHYERWPAFDMGVGALEPRDITVYVPVGGATATDLPVVYMHDGQNVFDPSAPFGGWRVGTTVDALVDAGDIPPVLVVAVDNTPARFDEYTHVPDDLGGMVVGGRADEYADFLVDGLVPFVAARYPVATGPAATAVVGSSLGGLLSLYLGWRHPDVFGWVGSLSGTVGWGSFGLGNPTIGELYLDTPASVSIYLDSGGSEGLGCPDGDTDNYCDNVALADLLRGLGWVDEFDLVYRWEPDAPHNEAAWADRVAGLLTQWRFAGG